MKLKHFFFLFFLLSSSSNIINAQEVNEGKALKSASISYEVINLTDNKIIASRNADQCATPASITKLITTATALELLGGDFQFSTYIETNGQITDGVLKGDLIIRGGVDPTLGSIHLGDRKFINLFVKIISNAGINKIEGDVIVDPTCLDRCPTPQKWNWEDMGFYYGAGCFGIAAYDNTSVITLNSHEAGSKPDIININPVSADLKIINEIEALNIRKDSIMAFNSPYGQTLYLQGGMPVNKNNYFVKTSIPNPPRLVASELYETLKSKGINVTGQYLVQNNYTPEKRTLIYEYKSRPLRDIIKLTNFKSNNLYAEHIFRRLGNLINPHEATTAESVKVIKNFWAKQGIDVNTLFLYDGCGLAPQDAYSAHTLNLILTYMRKSKNWNDFFNSLPRAGIEGTVDTFLSDTPLEGKAHIKSGSISSVQCFAGYLMPGNNEYAFTVMINNYNCKRKDVRHIIESWLLDIIK